MRIIKIKRCYQCPYHESDIRPQIGFYCVHPIISGTLEKKERLIKSVDGGSLSEEWPEIPVFCPLEVSL